MLAVGTPTVGEPFARGGSRRTRAGARTPTPRAPKAVAARARRLRPKPPPQLGREAQAATAPPRCAELSVAFMPAPRCSPTATATDGTRVPRARWFFMNGEAAQIFFHDRRATSGRRMNPPPKRRRPPAPRAARHPQGDEGDAAEDLAYAPLTHDAYLEYTQAVPKASRRDVEGARAAPAKRAAAAKARRRRRRGAAGRRRSRSQSTCRRPPPADPDSDLRT